MTPTMLTPETLAAEAQAPETDEFEIVLGRRQVASVLFVTVVIVVMFSAASYLAAKAVAPRLAAAAPPPIILAAPAAPPAPVLEAAIVKPAEGGKPEPPLFADPVTGAVYIQIGALDKGIAVVVAEGLRKHALEAFLAPGPTDKVFRVLIGPLSDPDSFKRVKDTVDQLGLTNFARRYEKESAKITTASVPATP